MTAVIYTLGVVLFLLGVLASIALHEIGHMVPAKLFGIKVTQYMVGFGKTIWSVKRGDTEYGVKAIPLGGYIRMIGMLPPARRDASGRIKGIRSGFFGKLIADARAAEYDKLTPGDEPRLFYRKAWWKKLIVMTGGPAMNIVIAVFLLGIVFIGLGVQTPTLEVSSVSKCVIPASDSGSSCRNHPLAPAYKAGFKPGDVVESFNGVRMTSWDQFSKAIRANGSALARIVVLRHGSELTLTTHTVVSQRPSLTSDNPDAYVNVGFLGVTPGETLVHENAGYVASTMWSYTERTTSALAHLPQRMVNVAEAALGVKARDPQGPISVIGAGRVAGEIASDHSISVTDRLATLLTLLGVINLFVALFNFIPLLPLDGGHIAGALYEALKRGVARLRGRPDPGYADVAQLLPIAYAAASVLVVMGVLLVWADIVNPITLSG